MNSIYFRLLITFGLIGITPYLFIMAYFSYWENNKIIDNIQKDYQLKAEYSKKMIENTLLELQEEIAFISKLEILDDMISNDIDLQISQILEQKSIKANQKYLELYAVDLEGKIIATSKRTTLNTPFELSTADMHMEYLIQSNNLYIIKSITSSFDHRALGHLVAKFNLDLLQSYLIRDEKVSSKISKIDHTANIVYEDETFMYGYIPLSNLMHEYEIVYAIDKAKALNYIYDFLFYLLSLTLMGAIVILLISRKITAQITKPIFELLDTSKRIVEREDYHLRTKTSKIVEFNHLSKNFNTLFETTEKLLATLKSENEKRLKNYIALSETFNAISQAQSDEESIQLSILSLQNNLSHTVILEDKSIEIADKDSLNSQELIFLDSVTLMLKNQLEKISLLDKIHSASNAKTAFISAMSHELRTPLNAIIGYSQYLITYEELEDDQVDTVSKIETAAYHLLEIINDILDIAKIEAGKIEKKIENINVHDEIQASIDITQALTEQKGLELNVDIESVSKLNIQSDKKIFKQIMINLISNAVKFTDKGFIAISARTQNRQLLVEIKDSGIGISKEDLGKIFDEFTQLKNAKKTKSKGSGLGLSLCKHLSKEIGAELNIESEGLNQGSSALLKFNL